MCTLDEPHLSALTQLVVYIAIFAGVLTIMWSK